MQAADFFADEDMVHDLSVELSRRTVAVPEDATAPEAILQARHLRYIMLHAHLELDHQDSQAAEHVQVRGWQLYCVISATVNAVSIATIRLARS